MSKRVKGVYPRPVHRFSLLGFCLSDDEGPVFGAEGVEAWENALAAQLEPDQTYTLRVELIPDVEHECEPAQDLEALPAQVGHSED